MKPLIVLISVFIAVFIGSGLFGSWNYVLAGNVAMASMMVFTAIGHFIFPVGVAMMLPDFVPNKNLVVFLSGVLEVLAAVGLMIPSTRNLTAVLLMLFFILVLPVNIIGAKRHVDFEKADNTGKGVDYLWLRIPIQLLFFVWAWFFGVFSS